LITNALHGGVGNVQRIIGNGTFEVVSVIQQHCLDTFDVSQGFFSRLSNKVFRFLELGFAMLFGRFLCCSNMLGRI
jgi:hypothetical protein